MDSSASSSDRYNHLLQPIRDLAKNWDLNIATALEDYLEDLENLTVTINTKGTQQSAAGEVDDDEEMERDAETGANSHLNFAEAALLIQGSACIYSRKVEYLHTLVFQVLDLLTTQHKKNRSQNGGQDGANGKEKIREGGNADENKEEGGLCYLLDDTIVIGTSKDLDLKRDSKEEETEKRNEDPNTLSISINVHEESGSEKIASAKDENNMTKTSDENSEQKLTTENEIIQPEDIVSSFTSSTYGTKHLIGGNAASHLSSFMAMEDHSNTFKMLTCNINNDGALIMEAEEEMKQNNNNNNQLNNASDNTNHFDSGYAAYSQFMNNTATEGMNTSISNGNLDRSDQMLHDSMTVPPRTPFKQQVNQHLDDMDMDNGHYPEPPIDYGETSYNDIGFVSGQDQDINNRTTTPLNTDDPHQDQTEGALPPSNEQKQLPLQQQGQQTLEGFQDEEMDEDEEEDQEDSGWQMLDPHSSSGSTSLSNRPFKPGRAFKIPSLKTKQSEKEAQGNNLSATGGTIGTDYGSLLSSVSVGTTSTTVTGASGTIPMLGLCLSEFRYLEDIFLSRKRAVALVSSHLKAKYGNIDGNLQGRRLNRRQLEKALKSTAAINPTNLSSMPLSTDTILDPNLQHSVEQLEHLIEEEAEMNIADESMELNDPGMMSGQNPTGNDIPGVQPTHEIMDENKEILGDDDYNPYNDFGDGGNFDDDDDYYDGGALDDTDENRYVDAYGSSKIGGNNDDMEGKGYIPMSLDMNQPSSYEDICRRHIEHFMRGVENFTNETSLLKRIGQWQEKLEPVLQSQEKRIPFDIHMYGDRVMSRLKHLDGTGHENKLMVDENQNENLGNMEEDPMDISRKEQTLAESALTKNQKLNSNINNKNTISFSRVIEDIDSYEVCRMFLASLQLANNGSIYLTHAANHEDDVDGLTFGMQILQ